MTLDDRLRAHYAATARAVPDMPVPSIESATSSAHRVVVRRRLLVVSTAAVLAVALALGASSLLRPKPAEVIAPPPGSVFSAVHHYSAVPPSGWTVSLASRPWLDGMDSATKGVSDVYHSPTGTDQITVVSQPLPPGQTADQWIQEWLPKKGDVEMPQCFVGPPSWDKITVDGVQGGLLGGFEWCSFTAVLVVAHGRAYVINATPDPDNVVQRVFDFPTLDSFLSSMRLTA